MSQIAKFTVFGKVDEDLKNKLMEEFPKLAKKRFWNKDVPSLN